MATFKVVVRKKRADGFYPVYIRVVHRSRMGYIKTDKLITDKQITKNGEIKDIVVNEYCSREILRYSDMINRKDVSNYSVAELIEFLIHSDEEICFSDYATKFINRMASEGHERNAKNYRLAVNHLERYLGTTRVMFTHLSSSVLTRWINSLSLTNRAKEMYPTCLRQIFKRALIELNDEERGIVRIKYNPWLKVSIPKSDSTVQRAISAEACREFFNRPLPETKMISSLPELGRDVALLSLCLGGHQTGTAYPSASGGQFRSFFQHHITTAMQYGQIVFLFFVAMVFYYAAMIFMDFQRAKAAQNAEQDNHKEEDIDISEEARSFRPIRINRNEPESKEQSSEQSNTENPEPENENTDSDGTEKSASQSESSRHVYREAIMTDGILVENIIQEINRLAETGTSDLGAVIFSCENA